jgi:seryl-tRNA synthetase
LSELGYFPGIVPTLASVEREAALLKADNVKMFEDNRALAHLVSVQTDRINRDAERVANYDELKRRLNEVINERDQLRQMVATAPAPDSTVFSNMAAELEKTKAELGAAMAQIKQMTAQLAQQHFLVNPASSSNTMLGHGPTEPSTMSIQVHVHSQVSDRFR